MRVNLHASEMTPEEQFEELASILAAGVIRLRKLRKFGEDSAPENLSDSDQNPLDVPAETRLSVTGVNDTESLERRTK